MNVRRGPKTTIKGDIPGVCFFFTFSTVTSPQQASAYPVISCRAAEGGAAWPIKTKAVAASNVWVFRPPLGLGAWTDGFDDAAAAAAASAARAFARRFRFLSICGVGVMSNTHKY